MSGAEYVRAHDVESNEAVTTTEWGVEVTARLRIAPDRLLTKVFQFRSQEEAAGDLETRSKLSFVNTARIVRREVTATPWEEPR